MQRYQVKVTATVEQTFEVKANSPQEARRIFFDDPTYQEEREQLWLLESECLEEEIWAVYDEDENEVTDAWNKGE
jgi:hypothetical protein